MRPFAAVFRVFRMRTDSLLFGGVTMRRYGWDFIFVITMAATVSVSCSTDSWQAPSAPSATGPAGSLSSSATGQGLPLTAVIGSGSGTFTLVHTESNRDAIADAQLTITVRGVAPNTVLYVRRAGDIGLGEEQANGQCLRAAQGLFGPVLGPEGEVSLTTSPGGAGAVHVHLTGPTPEGTTLDTVYRLVDAVPPGVPTIDLRTPCFTFTVK